MNRKDAWLTKQRNAQTLARQYGLSFGCPCGREAQASIATGPICSECAAALYRVASDAHQHVTHSSGAPYQTWNGIYNQHITTE